MLFMLLCIYFMILDTITECLKEKKMFLQMHQCCLYATLPLRRALSSSSSGDSQ